MSLTDKDLEKTKTPPLECKRGKDKRYGKATHELAYGASFFLRWVGFGLAVLLISRACRGG